MCMDLISFKVIPVRSMLIFTIWVRSRLCAQPFCLPFDTVLTTHHRISSLPSNCNLSDSFVKLVCYRPARHLAIAHLLDPRHSLNCDLYLGMKFHNTLYFYFTKWSNSKTIKTYDLHLSTHSGENHVLTYNKF